MADPRSPPCRRRRQRRGWSRCSLLRHGICLEGGPWGGSVEVVRRRGGWLADWLACWLACLLLPMAQRTRSIAEAQDRARLGRGCGGMYLYAGGRARRARQDQIWPEPDLAAMQCHGMPRQATPGHARPDQEGRRRSVGECSAPGSSAGIRAVCVRNKGRGGTWTLRRWAPGLPQQDVDGGFYSVYIAQCSNVLVYRAVGPVDVKLRRGPWPWGFRFPIRSVHSTMPNLQVHAAR